MSGYIGATVVGLETTAADVTGDITATDDSPELTLKNSTHEDTDGGREGKITFKGEQSGGEESTLAQIQASHDGTSDDEKGDLIFKTNDGSDGASPTEAMRIDSSQNVGIGCVPNSIQSGFDTLQIGGNLTLNVDGTGAGAGVYMGNNVYRDSGNSRWEYTYTDEASQYVQAGGEHIWRYAASGTADTAITWSEAMRINSDGNVGIGTGSPQVTFDCQDDSALAASISGYSVASSASRPASGALRIGSGAGSTGLLLDYHDGGQTKATIRNQYVASNDSELSIESPHITFNTGTSYAESMRIDSSGNLLVGKTAQNHTDVGHTLYPAGGISVVRSGGQCAVFNRTTSNGTIIDFRREGTTRGKIDIDTSHFGIGSVATGFYFYDGISSIIPAGTSDNFNNGKDNSLDLGSTSHRWDDIYATNGTIQTSDEREKQQIASLTNAEMTAAKAISKLFKTFKWNDSVAENGDNARTHTGVIAQQVENAMSDAGLDAGNYAFFISTTWWETSEDIAAVEAVEAQDAVYDDDGNLVSEAVEAVEAQNAYTKYYTYYTAEEAPEGATERNRKGIRYPELLSFIGAATEQRLTSIEARLDALEG